jgi:hypothetical protein
MTHTDASAGLNARLQDALALYRSLSDQLNRAIARLSQPEDDALPEAKARNEMIKAHQKALQTVLELEQRAAEQDERDAAARRYLDIAAARDEVLGRLARLRSIKRG